MDPVKLLVILLCGLTATRCFADEPRDTKRNDAVQSDVRNFHGYETPHVYFRDRRKGGNQASTDSASSSSPSPPPSTTQTGLQVNYENDTCEAELQECKKRDVKYHKTDASTAEVYYKRLVNMLLANAQIVDDEISESVHGRIEIEATYSQIQILRSFGNGQTSFQEIDSIFSAIIVRRQTNIAVQVLGFVQLSLTFLQENIEICSLLVAICFAYYLLRFARLTLSQLILTSLFVIFLASFWITWSQMIKEKQIKVLSRQMKYMEVPPQCNPNKMTWWETIKTTIHDTDHCEKYYEAVMADPRLQVTPVEVLSHVMALFFLHPAEILGSAVGSFVDKATGRLPFLMSWVVTPLLFVGVIGALAVLPIYLTGGSIGFGLGPLLHFSLKGGPEEGQRRPIEKISEALLPKPEPAALPVPNVNIHLSLDPRFLTEANRGALLAVTNSDSKSQPKVSEEEKSPPEAGDSQTRGEEECSKCKGCCKKAEEEIGSGDA